MYREAAGLYGGGNGRATVYFKQARPCCGYWCSRFFTGQNAARVCKIGQQAANWCRLV